MSLRNAVRALDGRTMRPRLRHAARGSGNVRTLTMRAFTEKETDQVSRYAR